MELAVNLFNKGLLIDSHPMVLSNDTLTDALNATFVTMNGNEVVLQNDMGNRKIDHANLPSGYEPVGMKEYGGIIYVAAYNPLTNRGQIGSFPSPQRKLSINNSEYNLLLTDFLDIKNKSISIKVDNITVPISGDFVLHTGDKFSIYSEEIGNIILYLVPLKQNGILKNNLFSFQVGIFNSQNEFIDISNKLINLKIEVVKQENNENINYTYNYYITKTSGIKSNSESDTLLDLESSEIEPNLNNTLSDLKLLEARNSLAINTYSYKMSSPLYLRMKLNHVNNITYTIDGDITEELVGAKNVNLYISVTFHYNCIDEIDKNYFKLLFNGDEKRSLEEIYDSLLEENSENNLKKFNPIYSEELDEYQVTLNYLVEVEGINSSEFNYILEFPLLNDFELFTFKNADNNIIPIIQNNLTLENSINIGLLGSDSVIFSGYRYLFNESSKQITLELDIESYPKKKGSSNYKIAPTIYYYDNNNKEIKYLLPFIEGENGKSPVSGVYTMTFNYELLGLEERKLYHIKLLKTYDEQNYLDLENGNSGIIITTSIFNGNYIGSKPFKEGVTLNGGKYDYEIAKDDYIDNFLKIQKLILTPIINVTYDLYSSGISLKAEGQLICELSESEPTSYYSITEDYNMVTKIYPSASLKNIELLPKELESKISLENTAISVIGRTVDNNLITKSNNVNGNVHFEGSYIYSQNLVEFRGEIEKMEEGTSVIEMDEDVLNNEITTHVIVHNFIDGKLVEKPILCRRVITSLYDFLIKSIFDNSKKYYHISEPYATLDFEDSSTKLGVRMDSGPITDHTSADDDGRKIFTSPKYPQDAINDTFRQYTENLFILEYSTDDKLVGFPPVYESFGQYNKASGIKRIWMRVSEKEYTPIFARSISLTDEELSTKIFDDDIDQRKFKEILSYIPHYYSYSEDSKTINRKIIDYHNLAASKEFDVSSFINVRVLGNMTLDNTVDYYCTLKLENINTELSIKEKNIKSNGLILDKLNILSSLELDCILEDSDKNIYYTDRDGNIFDPQYVYYIYNEDLSPKTFKKSYKANKFYVSDLKCEFPELKDSSLLYHKSNGEPHPYVNPKVCGNLSIVGYTIGWSWITLQDSSKKDDSGRDFSTLYRQGLIIKISDTALFDHSTYSIPAFLDIKDDNTVYWDPEITMALYEPEKMFLSYARYITKNIFNLKCIRKYNLYKKDDNVPDGWVDADSPQ